MSFSPRTLLVFFGRFFALLLIFSLIWYWLSLFYAGPLVGVGNGALRALGDMLIPAILCVSLTLRGQLRLTPREAHL